MTESSQNIFDLYYEAVKKLCPLTKANAIKLSENPSSGTVSLATIKKLYESLSCDGWKIQEQAGTNWVWKGKVGTPSQDNESPEVLLERAVAGRDVKQWTYQMSTSSGVQRVEGKKRRINLNSRRSIDLVRFIKQGHYAFVELKAGSDNPLYAAFEILGYALAYLHSRANAWSGPGEHDVFDAENIELTILGPENWYIYNRRGSGIEVGYKLDWLADEIETALNAFVTAEFKGKPKFTMKFRKFAGDNLDQRTADIHHQAECEWWCD